MSVIERGRTDEKWWFRIRLWAVLLDFTRYPVVPDANCDWCPKQRFYAGLRIHDWRNDDGWSFEWNFMITCVDKKATAKWRNDRELSGRLAINPKTKESRMIPEYHPMPDGWRWF